MIYFFCLGSHREETAYSNEVTEDSLVGRLVTREWTGFQQGLLKCAGAGSAGESLPTRSEGKGRGGIIRIQKVAGEETRLKSGPERNATTVIT